MKDLEKEYPVLKNERIRKENRNGIASLLGFFVRLFIKS